MYKLYQKHTGEQYLAVVESLQSSHFCDENLISSFSIPVLGRQEVVMNRQLNQTAEFGQFVNYTPLRHTHTHTYKEWHLNWELGYDCKL